MDFAGALNLQQIPVRGKHLDDLEPIDVTFVMLNKIATIPFVYFLAKYLFYYLVTSVSFFLKYALTTPGSFKFTYIPFFISPRPSFPMILFTF